MWLIQAMEHRKNGYYLKMKHITFISTCRSAGPPNRTESTVLPLTLHQKTPMPLSMTLPDAEWTPPPYHPEYISETEGNSSPDNTERDLFRIC